MVKKIPFSRRSFIGQSMAAAASTAFATPALALSEDYMLQRGDLRIGLLADYPPFTMKLPGHAYSGILPSIAIHFAHELWLTPSFSVVPRSDLGLFSYTELFERHGGLDIIMHAMIDQADKEQLPHTDTYMIDSLNYFGVPDVREIAIFPANFSSRKLLVYPDIIVNRMIVGTNLTEGLQIDFDVSNDDVYGGLVFEKIINNEYDLFMSSRRQIEWMMRQSRHKFYLNEVRFLQPKSVCEFCTLINPKLPWLQSRLNSTLGNIRKRGNLANIYGKYGLDTTQL